jgi:hypothetical protein
MAGNLVGMLQWVRLLNVTSSHSLDKDVYVAEQYAAVLTLLHGPKTPQEVAAKMKTMAVELEELFDNKLTIPEEALQVSRAVAIDPMAIRWFDDGVDPTPNAQTMKSQELLHLEPPRDAVLQELPEKLRPRALGYIRIRFTLDPAAKRKDAPNFVGLTKAPDPTASYYFFLKESSLVRERMLGTPSVSIDDLRYYFVPASNAPPNAALPLSAPADRTGNQGKDGKQVLDQLEEQQRLETIRDKLKFWQGVQLAPAVGDWTVFLLDSSELSKKERHERIEDYRGKLVMTLRIPYLQVSPADGTHPSRPK